MVSFSLVELRRVTYSHWKWPVLLELIEEKKLSTVVTESEPDCPDAQLLVLPELYSIATITGVLMASVGFRVLRDPALRGHRPSSCDYCDAMTAVVATPDPTPLSRSSSYGRLVEIPSPVTSLQNLQHGRNMNPSPLAEPTAESAARGRKISSSESLLPYTNVTGGKRRRRTSNEKEKMKFGIM